MRRCLAIFLLALPLAADCRLPEPAPDALTSMSPADLVESGHARRAIQLLEPIVKEHPEDGNAAWLLSRAKASLGDLEGAMLLAEAALATDDANPAYHVQVALVAGRQAQGVSLLKQLGLVRRARKELDAALATDAVNPPANFGMMMFYFAAPGIIGGDKDHAKQIGETLAGTNPDMGYYYLGRLAVEMKDFASAETYFKKSIAENPGHFDALSALARLYEDQQPDQPHAEETSCQAVQAAPTRGDAWALLTHAYAMCGCWDRADEAVDHSQVIDATNLEPYYAYAVGAIGRGENLDVAMQYLSRYLAKPREADAPTEAAVHWQLGLAQEKRDNLQQAVAELQTALEQDPSLEAAKAELKHANALLKLEARH